MDQYTCSHWSFNFVIQLFFVILSFFSFQACSSQRVEKGDANEHQKQPQINNSTKYDQSSEAVRIYNPNAHCYMNTALKLLWHAKRFKKT